MRTTLKIIDCSLSPEQIALVTTLDFPAIPIAGDRIDVYEIAKEAVDEATSQRWDMLTWIVDHIFWCKDEEGIYPEIVCRCKEQE